MATAIILSGRHDGSPGLSFFLFPVVVFRELPRRNSASRDRDLFIGFITYLPLLVNKIMAVQEVSIDIKPGSMPNSINPKSSGKIPVAILSKPDFDASISLNINFLTFGHAGTETSLAFCNSEDVNGDGLNDLMCHFYTQQTGFQAGDTTGSLKGLTTANVQIVGQDSVNIVGK